jgi:hypothetical protein
VEGDSSDPTNKACNPTQIPMNGLPVWMYSLSAGIMAFDSRAPYSGRNSQLHKRELSKISGARLEVVL